MGDGRLNRAIEQGRARTTEIKGRVPELKERMPELKEQLSRQYSKMDVSWARRGYARALREGLLRFGLGPMIDWYVRRRAVGREVLDGLQGPVIFVANHSSHLDTPTILRALPRKWMNQTAVAAAADYFYKSRWKARGVALLFNTVPLGRNGGGLGNGATDHVDQIIGEGWSLLMFPEGTRSRGGEIGKVRSGAAVIAAQHGIDIVPIYVSGTHEAMPPGQNWPKRRPGRLLSRRHKVEVRFGRPIRPHDEAERREVMDEVRAFWDRKGRPEGVKTTPAAHDVLLIHDALRAYEARRGGQPAPLLEPIEPAADRSTTAA